MIRFRIWLHGLASGIITGLSTSFLSALGISGANAAGVKIQQLDTHQLLALTIIGGCVGAAAYLQKSPVPAEAPEWRSIERTDKEQNQNETNETK